MERLGSFWLTKPLYDFKGGNDASLPGVGVVFGPDGLLYGTTYQGGTYNNGTVFSLGPAPGICGAPFCPRTETVLYSFGYAPGVAGPTGEVTFDQAGNIYGTAQNGPHGAGGVYELTRSGNDWVEQVIYGFTGGDTFSGVIFDGAGNLYGTTTLGTGIVFQLVPSNGSWIENILYYLRGQGDGSAPHGGLIFDRAGNLYGTTTSSGVGNGGTVFELSPANGSWTFTTIYSFVGTSSCGPNAALAMDAAGSLYGTTVCDGAYGKGSAFKLTRSDSTWTYTTLHDFCSDGFYCSDGFWPNGKLVLDPAGNIYGTSLAGGSGPAGVGVVWEITP